MSQEKIFARAVKVFEACNDRKNEAHELANFKQWLEKNVPALLQKLQPLHALAKETGFSGSFQPDLQAIMAFITEAPKTLKEKLDAWAEREMNLDPKSKYPIISQFAVILESIRRAYAPSFQAKPAENKAIDLETFYTPEELAKLADELHAMVDDDTISPGQFAMKAAKTYGINPQILTQPDSAGNTILHKAAKKGNADKIRYLLELHFDKHTNTTIRNHAGQTAVELWPSSSPPPAALSAPKNTATIVEPFPTVPLAKDTKEKKETPIQKTFREQAALHAPCDQELLPHIKQQTLYNPSLEKFQQYTLSSLLLLFRQQLKPFLNIPKGETLHIVSLGAGTVMELLPLRVLAEEMDIKIYLWAIDTNREAAKIIEKNYNAFKKNKHVDFTYIFCDASNPQAVKKGLQTAGAPFETAPVTILRHPDARGDTSPESRAAFHKMVTETIPTISAADSILWCSWYMADEVTITSHSLLNTPGIYTALTPAHNAKPDMHRKYTIQGESILMPDHFTGVYRCNGQTFRLGKELRNLCIDKVLVPQFMQRLNEILNIDASLVNQPGPKDGNTPLHYAAQFGNVEKIDELLKRGANPNAVNKNGQTPSAVLAKGKTFSPELLARLQPATPTAPATTAPAKPEVKAGHTSAPLTSSEAPVSPAQAATKQGFLATPTGAPAKAPVQQPAPAAGPSKAKKKKNKKKKAGQSATSQPQL